MRKSLTNTENVRGFKEENDDDYDIENVHLHIRNYSIARLTSHSNRSPSVISTMTKSTIKSESSWRSCLFSLHSNTTIQAPWSFGISLSIFDLF